MEKKLSDFGDVMDVKDLRDFFGIGYNKAYELIRSGSIQSFRIGTSIRIPKRCVEEYIQRMAPIYISSE